MYEIAMRTGEGKIREAKLAPGVYRVGASPASHLRLTGSGIAPCHCQLIVTENGAQVLACAPEHSVFLDGAAVGVDPGSEIRLGSAVIALRGPESAATSAKFDRSASKPAAGKYRPLAYEVTLLPQELHLGITLDNMVRRLNCADFDLVAVAILTARQTGGELTATLERLAGMIRERVRIAVKVRALTAQGRMQALIIGLMPIVLFFAMMRIAPDMMKTFFATVSGILRLLAAAAPDGAGFILIRKITHIDI